MRLIRALCILGIAAASWSWGVREADVAAADVEPSLLEAASFGLFADGVGSPFADWSYGMHNLASTNLIRSGTYSAELDPSNYGGLRLHATQTFDATPYGFVDLWVNGGTGSAQNITVALATSSGAGTHVSLGDYASIQSNTWAHATIPFADLGVSGGNITDLAIQGATASAQTPIYVDDITFLPAAASGLSIFSDELDNGFTNGGWGTYSISQTAVVRSGKVAASLTPGTWDGVQFGASTPIKLTASNYTGFTFWVNGGASGGQKLWAGVTVTDNSSTYRLPVTNYTSGAIPANTWVQVTVPFADLKVSQFTLKTLYVMDAQGSTQPIVYFDDFALVTSTTGGTGRGTGTAGTGGGGTTTTTPSMGAAGWLYTKGNRIYHSDGTLFHGRGANIADPRGCGACTSTDLTSSTNEVIRRIDVLVDQWKANFLRLDLESYASGSTGVVTNAAYLAAIKQIVAHVQTKSNVYMELSVWVDPSLDGSGWPTDTTDQIWTTLATTFANTPQVLFGIANEPQNNYDGSEDSQVWTRMQAAAAAIRASELASGNNKHIVLAQGTGGWARFLTYYETHPLTAGDGSNFAYEVHVYDAASTFSDRFVTPSKTIPVVIGEFGPVSGSMTTTDTATLMTQAEAAGVPYIAWTFHMRCPPNLLVDNSSNGCGVGMTLAPSAWGQQLQTQLSHIW